MEFKTSVVVSTYSLNCTGKTFHRNFALQYNYKIDHKVTQDAHKEHS